MNIQEALKQLDEIMAKHIIKEEESPAEPDEEKIEENRTIRKRKISGQDTPLIKKEKTFPKSEPNDDSYEEEERIRQT